MSLVLLFLCLEGTAGYERPVWTPVLPTPSIGKPIDVVDKINNADSAELCKTMDAARKVLIDRFQTFLSKHFPDLKVEIPVENLKFSIVTGESGQFIRVEGLINQSIHSDVGDVMFADLCSTEGLRATPRNGVFDLEISVRDFDGKVVSAPVVPPSQEPTRVALRAPLKDPAGVAAQVRNDVAGAGDVSANDDGGHGRDRYGDESAGFNV